MSTMHKMLADRIVEARDCVEAMTALIKELDALTGDDIRSDPELFLAKVRENTVVARVHAQLYIDLAAMYQRVASAAYNEGVQNGTAAVLTGMPVAAGTLSPLPKPSTKLQDAVRGALRPANTDPKDRGLSQ